MSGQSRQVDGRFFFILRYFCPKSNAEKRLRQRAENTRGDPFPPDSIWNRSHLYDTSEEIVWQSGAKEESKANPATGDGFNTAVSAVMALSVLAGAAVVLGKKK